MVGSPRTQLILSTPISVDEAKDKGDKTLCYFYRYRMGLRHILVTTLVLLGQFSHLGILLLFF